MSARTYAAGCIVGCLLVIAPFGGVALDRIIDRIGTSPLWTSRITVVMPFEPVAIPDAPAPMPEPYTTGAYCLPRPFLAEITHLCRNEGGEIDL